MKFKDLKLQQIVFEARYAQGYRYLDRCGETMVEIEDTLEGWVAGEATPTGGNMKDIQNNILLNFNSLKFDLSQHKVKDLNCTPFKEASSKISKIISQNLGINDFLRLGLRFLLLYPVDSPKQGRAILNKTEIFKVNEKIEDLFGKKIKDTNVGIVLEEKGRGHRVSLSMAYREGVKIEEEENYLLTTPVHKLPSELRKKALILQVRQKEHKEENPDLGVLIDIDNYWLDSKIGDLDKFLDESISVTFEKTTGMFGK